MEFPRTVYTSPGKIRWNKEITYDAEIVHNESEYKAALSAGYIDNFNDALFIKKAKELTLNDEALALGMEGEEYAKFKRKNKEAKRKYLDKYGE